MKKSLYSPKDLINTFKIPDNLNNSLVKGDSAICNLIGKLTSESIKNNKKFRIAIDAHLGVDWKRIISTLKDIFKKKGINPVFLDIGTCLKSPETIDRMLKPNLPDDPTFGRIYKGGFLDFFDKRKLSALKKTLKKTECMICYGPGSALSQLRPYYDKIIYIDLCREEILKRFKMGLVKPLGAQIETKSSSTDGIPAYFSTKRLYYIDYAVLDKHRKQLLPVIDYYVDGNELKMPKMISGETFWKMLELASKSPVKPKPYYDPSPWGGVWLKKVRRLPKDMINCAWSYDLIEPETSFQAYFGKNILEFPFSILSAGKPSEVMGSKGTNKKFRGQFPIRINYDDGYKGGDMALQDHPNDKYIMENFDEPYRQDESYYIVDALPGSKVHLGLQEDADIEEFKKAVTLAEDKQIPFDHSKYVNSLPTEKGDLFLIPAGTLHGSGANENVLEISATTYRYTFHFYDFLRPGLDGKFRPIHRKHAFNNLKTYRRSKWVLKNLKQKPRLIRKGKGWAEYLLGTRKDMFFKVHRFEFDKEIKDNTKGEFHLLISVEGEGIKIVKGKNNSTYLPFSCLAVVPASMGAYKVEGIGKGPHKVVKVLMA